MREKIRHNMEYRDEAVFENLEIFKDLGDQSHKKVSGRKDNFNARNLLSQRMEDIQVSDDDGEKLRSEEETNEECERSMLRDLEEVKGGSD